MKNWHTDREQLEQCDIAQLQDIADEYGLYSDLSDEDDAPEKSEMISDIIEEAAKQEASDEEDNEREDHFEFLRNNPHGENRDD